MQIIIENLNKNIDDCLEKPTVILRHRKENLKKCSLRGLEGRSEFVFLTYPCKTLPDLSGYVLLTLDAPPLSEEDKDKGIFLIDGTWRYAECMVKYVMQHQPLPVRSIPKGWKTAYPRRQLDCPSPEEGLASIEALYAAYHALGKNREFLLHNYYWKNMFLEVNNLAF